MVIINKTKKPWLHTPIVHTIAQRWGGLPEFHMLNCRPDLCVRGVATGAKEHKHPVGSGDGLREVPSFKMSTPFPGASLGYAPVCPHAYLDILRLGQQCIVCLTQRFLRLSPFQIALGCCHDTADELRVRLPSLDGEYHRTVFKD